MSRGFIAFKVSTSVSGVMGKAFWLFLLIAFIGGGLRLFSFVGLMVIRGEKVKAKLSLYTDWLGNYFSHDSTLFYI